MFSVCRMYLLLSLLMMVLISSVKLYCVSATPPHTTRVVVNASSENCTNDTLEEIELELTVCQLSVAMEYVDNNTQVLLLPGNYMLENGFVFSHVVNFSLVGASDGDSFPIISCTDEAKLQFTYSGRIALSGIELVNCGGKMRRTNTYHYSAAVAFEQCWDINVTLVVFRRSLGSGLELINPSGNALVNGSLFLNATIHQIENKAETNFGGGGIKVFITASITGAVIVIQNSHLVNNTAPFGGGLHVWFADKAVNISLYILNSTFEGNNATLAGGGMFADMRRGINNTAIILESCSFIRNRCELNAPPNQCGGGGASLFLFKRQYEYPAINNTIEIRKNSSFIENEANYGAAIAVTAGKQNLKKVSFLVSEVHFSNNEAEVGPALYIHAPNYFASGYFTSVTIENCSVHRNINTNPVGHGVVLIFDVLTALKGKSYFSENKGTALTVVRAQINIIKSTTLIFDRNTGSLGGAIALLKGATMLIRHVVIRFSNNHAEVKGGAIYISDIYWNSCPFVYQQYSHKNIKWNITFINNTAGDRSNSVFITSTFICEEFETSSQPFCWTDWHYGSNNCSQEVQTAPHNITVTSQPFSVFPGKSKQLPLLLSDDYGKDVSNITVLTLSMQNGSLYSPHFTFANGNVTIYGIEGEVQTLIISTAEPRIMKKNIIIVFDRCPPGYTGLDNRCVCASSIFGGQTRLSCDDVTHRANLYWRWCMTPYGNKNNTVIVAGNCWPFMQLNESAADGFLTLPAKPSLLDKHFCGHFNRTSTLCSQCIEGYGIPVLSYDSKCVECSSGSVYRNVVKYIAAQYIPLTGFLLLIVLFKISVNNGHANMFVLYAQTFSGQISVWGVQFVLLQKDNLFANIGKYVVIPLYAIWNLEFFQTLLPPFCISTQLSPLIKLALKYIVAMYPLVIIFLFLVINYIYEKDYRIVTCILRPIDNCLARIYRKLGITNTLVDAFATFITLSYDKVCWVSFQILGFNTIHISNNTSRSVLHIDASIEYWDSAHTPYFILAVFFLATYVAMLPLLLLLYPLNVFQRCLDRLHLRGRVVQTLFDSFTGCYKDGSNSGIDCRYFASFYFILRIVEAFMVYMIPADMKQTRTSIEAVATIVLLFLLIILKPYRKNLINYLDIFIITCFSLLTIISGITKMWYNTDLTSQKVVFFLISSLPLLYITLLVIYLICKKFPWHWLADFCCCRSICSRLLQQKQQSNDNFMCSHRLLHPGEYSDTPSTLS